MTVDRTKTSAGEAAARRILADIVPLAAAAEREQPVDAFLAFGYTYITLDLAGFRSAGPNEALTAGRSTAEIGSV